VNRYNLNEPEFSFDDDDPDGYHTGYDRIGPKLGGEKVGATHYLIRPGQSLCPYHYEYGEEEWLLVLEGAPTIRTPAGAETLREGDIVAFPEGPDGAHKVTNDTGDEVRVLMWSNIAPLNAAVYPDSDKILINPPDRSDRVMVERSSDVDYWVGER
jgi:uncharacterized cupin superfamily protein